MLHNRLTEEETQQKAFSFFGVQGPWYTVGWKMAVTIERRYGRAKLIACMCDQRKLLATYNSAAKRTSSRTHSLAVWSGEVVEATRPSHRASAHHR